MHIHIHGRLLLWQAEPSHCLPSALNPLTMHLLLIYPLTIIAYSLRQHYLPISLFCKTVKCVRTARWHIPGTPASAGYRVLDPSLLGGQGD